MGKTKRVCTLLVRFLAVGATAAAAAVMATSHEKTRFFALTLEAKYSHTPAFEYFVVVNGIGSVYSLLVLFLPPQSLLWRLVIPLDVVIAMLLTSGISAALGVAYVGKKGNSYTGWQPICNRVPVYCHHVSASLIAGFVGVLLYLTLLLHSLHSILHPLVRPKN